MRHSACLDTADLSPGQLSVEKRAEKARSAGGLTADEK